MRVDVVTAMSKPRKGAFGPSVDRQERRALGHAVSVAFEDSLLGSAWKVRKTSES
jgi:hypothetical protein